MFRTFLVKGCIILISLRSLRRWEYLERPPGLAIPWQVSGEPRLPLITLTSFIFYREQHIINIPGNGIVMDPAEIAKALEAKYQTPSIHLSDATVQAAIEVTSRLAGAVFIFLIHTVPVRLLQDYDAQYFNRTMEKQLGKP
jgi:hypothetical protein